MQPGAATLWRMLVLQEKYVLNSQRKTSRMPPKNGLDFKAARRPYYLADEVSYERFVLAYYIGDAVEPHNLLACLDLRHVR